MVLVGEVEMQMQMQMEEEMEGVMIMTDYSIMHTRLGSTDSPASKPASQLASQLPRQPTSSRRGRENLVRRETWQLSCNKVPKP